MTVMQTLNCISGLHNVQEFSQQLHCLDKVIQTLKKSSYYWFFKIFLKNMYKSQVSQQCLHPLIITHLLTSPVE